MTNNFGTYEDFLTEQGEIWKADTGLKSGGYWVSSQLLYNSFCDFLEGNSSLKKPTRVQFGKMMSKHFQRNRRGQITGYLLEANIPYLLRYELMGERLTSLLQDKKELSAFLNTLRSRKLEFFDCFNQLGPFSADIVWLGYNSPSNRILRISERQNSKTGFIHWVLDLDFIINGQIEDSSGKSFGTLKTEPQGQSFNKSFDYVDAACKLAVLAKSERL